MICPICRGEMQREGNNFVCIVCGEEIRTHYDESKWIPVTERLPSREGRYITAFSKGEVGQNVFMIFHGAPAKWYYNSEDTGVVTHWMPLPEPPKEE